MSIPRLGYPLLALACALSVGALAAPAQAYRFQPERHRWERSTVPVYTITPGLRSAVASAITKWNALGLRVRLVRAPTRRQAFVTVRTQGSGCFGGVTQVLGARQSGSVGGRSYSVRYIARARAVIAPRCGPSLTKFVVAHELGHVLGLGHETRVCALMNPSADDDGASPQCPPRPVSVLARNPLRPDDRAGVRALYRRPLSTLRLAAYEQYFDF